MTAARRYSFLVASGVFVAGAVVLAVYLSRDQSPATNVSGTQHNTDASSTPERSFWRPHELVAVVGEERGRNWGSVYSLAISPDGKRIASGGEDGYIRFWDAATLQPTGALSQRLVHIYGVAFSRDGKLLAASDGSRQLQIWDISTEPPRERVTLEGHGTTLHEVAISADAQTLATYGGRFGAGQLWDLTADPPRPRNILPRGQRLLAFSPDTNRVATAGFSEGLQVGDTTENKIVATMKFPHSNGIEAAAFSADGNALATLFRFLGSPYVAIWDLAVDPPRSRTVRLTNSDAAQVMAFSPTGDRIATGGYDSTIHVWDLTADPPKELPILKGHRDHVNALIFSRDGKTLISGGQDHTIRLWDLTADPPVERLPARDYPHSLHCVDFAPEGKRIALGGYGRQVWLCRLTDDGPKDIAILRGHTGIVTSVAFSPDGKLLASTGSSEDFTARLWDVTTDHPAEKAVLRGHKAGLSAVQFASNGKMLATASNDKTVRLWRLTGDKPEPLAILEGHRGWVNTIAFSPGGNDLASGGQDGDLRQWNRPSSR